MMVQDRRTKVVKNYNSFLILAFVNLIPEKNNKLIQGRFLHEEVLT